LGEPGNPDADLAPRLWLGGELRGEHQTEFAAHDLSRSGGYPVTMLAPGRFYSSTFSGGAYGQGWSST
jgi:hypothetical protein